MHENNDFVYVASLLFDKKQTIESCNETFPESSLCFSSPPWYDEKLIELKNCLNAHKSKLNDLNLEEWSSHTRRHNPAGEVSWRLRNEIDPEFLTQAWTKFYECAYTFKIIPEVAKSDKKLVSLHLCEAPGAFITSLNHYLKLHHDDIKWEWRASTLNPYYEGNSPSNMIDDDRFMFHTLDQWDFGCDETGNLMNWENSQAIIENAKKLGKVLLVTADGSIDCMERPDDQEEITSSLHYCEIVTALQALSEGGTFIFKTFTMFEHYTICILYLISICFETIHIFKPATSKQGNSEVYVVCLNYKGTQCIEPYISALKKGFGTELYYKMTLFPKEVIPVSFLKQIRTCAHFFSIIQGKVIDSNLGTFRYPNRSFSTNVKEIREGISRMFIERYKLTPLTPEQEVLKGKLHENDKINLNPKYKRGSFTQIISYGMLSSKDKLHELLTYLYSDVFNQSYLYMNENLSLDLNDVKVRLEQNKNIKIGSPIAKINSSKFIYSPILKLYKKIFAVDEFRNILLGYDCAMKNITEHLAKKDNTLCFSECDEKEMYDSFEKNNLHKIHKKIEKLKLGDDLILINFNLLTHFNVCLMNLLARRYFSRIIFNKNSTILLKDHQKKSGLISLNQLVSECDKQKRLKKAAVLSAYQVKITNSGELYDAIVLYNNTTYIQKCENYLEHIKHALKP